MHIAAQHSAVGGDVGYQGAAGAGGIAVAPGELVFVSHPLARQGPGHIGLHHFEDFLPDHVLDLAPFHLIGRPAEPFGVALVGVAVGPFPVEVSDGGGDGIGNLAQALLAAAQGLGDGLVAFDGGRQLLVGPGQGLGAGFDVLLKLRLMARDLLGRMALVSDVGVDGDEALVRQRKTTNGEDAAIGTDALGHMGLEALRPGHPFGDLLGRVSRAVVAALGVVADERLEGHPRPGQPLGKIQQTQEGGVPRHHAQFGVEHGDTLIQQIKACSQHFLVAPFGGRLGLPDCPAC